ncbi:MAG: DUF3847 domain-containing protein [Acutalibacter sp.]|nr:DUF3847 domain-containing protein [Acutalibacter sp.]
MGRSIAEHKAKLNQDKARAEREIYQLQNKQKILLNRIRSEERRARNHRLIQHGLILEGVFPATINTDGEAVKAFLIALSRLPGAQELEEKTLNGETTE